MVQKIVKAVIAGASQTITAGVQRDCVANGQAVCTANQLHLAATGHLNATHLCGAVDLPLRSAIAEGAGVRYANGIKPDMGTRQLRDMHQKGMQGLVHTTAAR